MKPGGRGHKRTDADAPTEYLRLPYERVRKLSLVSICLWRKNARTCETNTRTDRICA
jgi:hypothetical protein